nr:MAG: hypothetical protein [Bacteriophage sp.]
MKNIIDVNPMTRVFLASELGDQIQRGLFKQVGQIRTEYVQKNIEGEESSIVQRSVTAVIHDLHLDKFYEIEQYRGLAIRAEIGDEEMLGHIRELLPTLGDDEGFVYDQRIERGVEYLESADA